MGNSYFLYKKYFKIGQQDWLPVLPEEYSFSGDSENPMPMVLKKEDDRLCGNIPPIPPVYRWHQLPISEDYECSAGTKYYVDVYQISYDGGNTWEDVVPERTRTGAVYQTGSSDCIEYRWHQLPISEDYICDECPEGQYRWTATTGYVCSGVNKMTREIEEVSYDSGTTWTPTGDERAALPLIEADSPDCGYVPPIEPQYRWVVSTGYVCSGTNKMTREIEEVSYDSGTTWTPTGDERAALPLIEADSEDCGYIPPSYSAQYLTFVAKESGTFKLTGNTVNYSLDNGTTWSTLAINTNSPTVSAGNKIMWKATITPGINKGVGRFSSTGQFDVEGNAMSLLYGDNFQNQTSLTGKSYAFYGLFYNCTTVVSAKYLSLPATTLANECYSNMFYGCTNLTTAPQLPATTLAERCYVGMFNKCSGLTTPPSILPATTLANECYSNMFRGCTSLTKAPVLPATTLADDCYNYMFQGCTSLTAAPVLPATTLANRCYYTMFSGCTSLATAPVLPATTLANECYSYMLQSCTSLTTAPELPATTLVNSCYKGIFAGCTSLTTAPALSVTTLAENCYQNMFWSCTSLTTAPVLPATTLASDCYNGMFYGCINLNSITCLATDISASNCTYYWVYGVPSMGGTFTKASSMIGWTSGINGIPNGWAIQNYNS